LRFSPPSTQGSQGPGFLQRLLPRRPTFRPPSKPDDSGPNRTVWTLRDGAPVANAVVIGATDGRRTQILKGDVAPDQPVIVDTITAKR
jgi:HlyD family secretion protein